ncbi:hypothetical protein L208DRAFT_1419182 [Tricholoma matsutake]|nr:hypothetical protein L208DRAFT_1419182 [Tricholoma matsutake 945]
MVATGWNQLQANNNLSPTGWLWLQLQMVGFLRLTARVSRGKNTIFLVWYRFSLYT